MAVTAKKAVPLEPPTWMVKASDVTEVKYLVTCSNTTTRTEVSPANAVEIVEVSARGMLLRLPVRSCAFGHFLTLSVERRRSKPFAEPKITKPQPVSKKDGRKKRATVWIVEDKIQFTAKVTEIQPFGPKMLSVTALFYQCDQDHWAKFLEELGVRQRAVTRLVRRMSE